MDFESIINSIKTFVDDRLMSLLGAFCLLIVGWFFATLLIWFLKKFILRPLRLNEHFARVTSRESAFFDIEKVISRLCFLILILFLFLAVAQFAEFEKLQNLLVGVFDKIGVLLLMAWNAIYPIVLALICAFLAKKAVNSAGLKFNIDDRVGSKLDAGERVDFSVTKSLSEITYGVVFLLFLPSILTGLGLEKLSEPFEPFINGLGSFVPKLLAAALIIGIGWFVARVIKHILENFLLSTGVDNVLKKYGSEQVFGSLKISKIVPTVIYAIFVVTIVIKGFEKLELGKITEPIDNILNQVISSLPQVALAILIVLAGFYVGSLVAKFISDILKEMGFNNIFQKLGISEIRTGTKTPSELVGSLAHYSIIIILLIQALEKIGLESVSGVISSIVERVGDVLLGLVVFGIGLYIANVVSSWVRQSSTSGSSQLLAILAKGVIIVVTGAMALQQMQIAEEIVTIAFSLAMGSIALGAAIAIGLGCKELAGEVVRDFVNKLK